MCCRWPCLCECMRVCHTFHEHDFSACHLSVIMPSRHPMSACTNATDSDGVCAKCLRHAVPRATSLRVTTLGSHEAPGLCRTDPTSATLAVHRTCQTSSCTRHRLRRERPAALPWEEAQEQWACRAEKVVQWVNGNCNLDSLCRKFPTRLQQLLVRGTASCATEATHGMARAPQGKSLSAANAPQRPMCKASPAATGGSSGP